MTAAGSLSTFFHTHFSPEAGYRVRVTYMFTCGLIAVYTLVVLLQGVLDLCSNPRNRIRDDDEIKYTNPEYTTLGHCLQTRYAVLLGLTPQECTLCRRILLSVVLGMMIGFERRRPDRPAGVRTMSLVSLGSCVFTIDSMFAFSSSPDSWDSSRVAAAIPSGVGFLGAGLIYKQNYHDRHEVHGLTTASSVWLSAAAGIAAGGGLCVIALFSTLVVIVVLRFGPRLPSDDMDSTTRCNASEAEEEERRFHFDIHGNPKADDENLGLVEAGRVKGHYGFVGSAGESGNNRKPSLRE